MQTDNLPTNTFTLFTPVNFDTDPEQSYDIVTTYLLLSFCVLLRYTFRTLLNRKHVVVIALFMLIV